MVSRRDRRGVGELPPLVESKLAVPSVRHSMVDRPRIRRALDARDGVAVTLVAAPAGYGKTTAVRAWCARADAQRAWVTLDAGDNDATQLWTYVATAVDRVRSGLGHDALRRLRVSGSPIEDAVDALTNSMARVGGRLVLVLDDLHLVTDRECLSSIDHALAHLPANTRAVLISRVDPPLNLARLRVSGALAELRAGELAFTRAEARELLVALGQLDLGPAEIDVLVERTDGWPAALILAGLWLRTVDDRARAVRSFGGDHRFVAEYLSNEVLAALDDDRRSFLHGAAVLEELTAELCDAVLERTDSAVELAELERSNLFVSRLERTGWFRVHPLFGEYARAQLAASEPAAVTRIHRRAAEWLRSRGLPIDAVKHAAAAGEHEFVADVLIEYHLPLIRHGAARTLLRWVGTLPDDELVKHPELAAAAATATALVGGRRIDQRRLLRLADAALAGPPGGADPYGEAVVLLIRALTIDGGVAQAVRDGRRAVELARRGSDELLTGALAAHARALYFAGDLDQSRAVAKRVIAHPDVGRRTPSLAHARATLALVAVERGRLASARSHAEKAKAAVGRIGTSRSWLGAHASAAIGAVLAAEGNLVDAERELATAEHFFRDEVATLHRTWLLVLLARVRVRRGRLDEAEASLRTAVEALEELTDSGVVAALADEVERELSVARARARGGDVLEPPSDAELAVLRLLSTDLSTREIADRLFLSANTIRSHTRAVYRKLGVHSRAEAISRATALGLLKETRSPR
jgi:LuxR family maltose regulon positive regulatory protein